jgi:hypothetical protein
LKIFCKQGRMCSIWKILVRVTTSRLFLITLHYFSLLFCPDHIRTLVMSLCNRKLANFCRILAVTISDLDIYENKSSCESSSICFLHYHDVAHSLQCMPKTSRREPKDSSMFGMSTKVLLFKPVCLTRTVSLFFYLTELLLSIPDLIPRLVQIVISKECE